jgi:hypothetical protein
MKFLDFICACHLPPVPGSSPDLDPKHCALTLTKSVLEFQNNLWGAKNRVEIGLSYRPARIRKPAESIYWNRFLGSLKKFKNTVSGRLTCKNEDNEKKRRTAHTQQESEDEKGDPGGGMNDAA